MAFSFLRPVRQVKIGPDALAGETATGGFIVVDATISEEHEVNYEVTRHPVPQGISITDHKRREPRVLKMDCIISNTPIQNSVDGINDLTSIDEIAEGVQQNIDSLSASGTLARSERDTNAWQQLKAYAAGDDLMDVFTTLEAYRNMQITNLSTARTATTGQALHFSITLQEIRIADEETTEALQLQTGRPAISNQAQKGKNPRTRDPNALIDAASKAGGV